MAIVALAGLLASAWLLADDAVTARPSRPDGPAPALEGGRIITQSFVPPTDGLEAISMRLATYRQAVDGSVTIRLWMPLATEPLAAEPLAATSATSAARTLLAEWVVPGPSIEDTAWRRLPLPEPADDIAGRTLEVSLEVLEPGGNPPTVMRSEGDVYPHGTLFVDDRVLDGDMDLLLEMRPGRLGRAAYMLERTGYPSPIALALVLGLVACAVGFLYRSAPDRSDRTDDLADDRTDRPVQSRGVRQGRQEQS